MVKKRTRKGGAVPKEESKVSVQSLDDFMKTWSDEDEDDEYNEQIVANGHGRANGHVKEVQNEDDVEDDEDGGEEEGDEEEDDEAVDEANRAYMANLAEKDPEMFAFLKENDSDLLNFDVSDEEGDEAGGDDENSGAHVPPQSLEADSDDSDLDDDENVEKMTRSTESSRLSRKQLNLWSQQCSSLPSVSLLRNLTEALGKAIDALSLSSSSSSSSKMSGSLFNSVVKLCLNHFSSVLRRVLGLPLETTNAKRFGSSKKFRSVQKVLKSYTTHLVTLTSSLSSSSAVSAVLSTLTPQHMLPCFHLLPKQRKQLLKALIKRWSQQDGNDESEEVNSEVRINAFMAIVHLVRASGKSEGRQSHDNEDNDEDDDVGFFERVVKSMHTAYLRNSKFTSPSTYPFIHFMRRSLSELMLLQPRITYSLAFVFIRQLAIHVRNALVHNKKEHIQLIANWQFVHALHLWTHTLALTKEKKESKQLRSLVYPLTQVLSATCSVLSGNKFDPLRFHLTSMLTEIGHGSGFYVPVVPIFTELLMRENVGSKMGSKVSMRPVDFTCILRLSKTQMEENGTRDALIQHLHDGIVEHLALNAAHSIAFPELSVHLVMAVKRFLKKCKVANYARKMKTLVENVEKHAELVAERRDKSNIALNDSKAIKDFELKLKAELTNLSSPFLKYYEPLKKKREEEVLSTKKRDRSISFDHLVPRIERKKKKKIVDEEEEDFSLFGKDDEQDEDEEDLDEMFKIKEERSNKKRRNEEDDDEEEVNDDDDQPVAKVSKLDEEDDAIEDEDDVLEELKEEDLATDDDEDDEDEDEDDEDEDEDEDE